MIMLLPTSFTHSEEIQQISEHFECGNQNVHPNNLLSLSLTGP